MYYKCHKINFKDWGSCIELKNKKVQINLTNKDSKCFQYVVGVALNYEVIELHTPRVFNIKPFIDNYEWGGIKYPSKIDEWN